ncbi:MAG: hypothetical protein ACTSUF_11835 [Candidatus Heimdallarchaeaceae archaeon]
MASTWTEFYIKIAQMIIILSILGYFTYRRIKDKIMGFNWFIFLFSMAALQSVVEITLFFPTRAGKIDTNSAIQEIHIIPYAIGLFGLFLYTELIMYEKPRMAFFGFVTALLGAYITVFFVELGFNLEPQILPEYRIYRVLFNVFQSIVLFNTFIMFVKDARYVEFKKLKRISLYIAIAFGIAFVSSIIKIFEQWIQLLIPGFEIYGAIPFGIMFGILALEFIANPFYVYLLPTKIHKVIVINNFGILLYAVRIGKEAPEIFEDTLFSGTVSALKSLLAETTGAESDLRKICFRDKTMIIVENSNRKVSTIILGDSDSHMLQVAARHFTEEFYRHYHKHIDKFDGSVSIFDATTDIVRRVFPFVPPEEIVEEDITKQGTDAV